MIRYYSGMHTCILKNRKKVLGRKYSCTFILFIKKLTGTAVKIRVIYDYSAIRDFPSSWHV